MEIKSGEGTVWDKINDTKADIQKVESTVQRDQNIINSVVQALGNKTA